MPNGTCNITRRLWRAVGRVRLCAGFTMTELIVVIVMVGLVAAVVGMKSGWLTSSSNLREALDQVAGDLRFLQTRTMATMAYTGGTYTNTASFPKGGTTYYLGGQVKSLPAGVTLSIGGTLTVTFNSLGEYQQTAGDPLYGQDAVLTLNSKGLPGSITIHHLSGDVEASY